MWQDYMADALLTTRYIVHTRYESMLHLDFIKTRPLSKVVGNSFLSHLLLAMLQRRFP